MTTTKLGQIIASAPATAPDSSAPLVDTKLGKWRALGQRGEPTTIPGFGPVWIELVSMIEGDRIEGQVFAEMKALDLPPIAMHSITYDTAKCRKILAWAVRDPEDPTHETRFGTAAQWDSLDADMIATAMQVYNDVRVRLNPIDEPVTAEEMAGIRAALEKKNAMHLRLFGVAKLARYMLTTASQPSESPTSE